MQEEIKQSHKKYINKIRKRVRKTIYQHNLIQADDCVLVGLSGGKDSLALLDILAHNRRAFPFTYKIKAVHINVTNLPYSVDTGFLASYCKENDIEFEVVEFDIDFSRDTKLSKCFICSLNRRTSLFKYTEKWGCTKLAFGHHMDDANETLLMNMLFNAEISSLPYKVQMFDGKFDLIRPLLDITGPEVARYAKILGLSAELRCCPFTRVNRRAMAKKALGEFYKINDSIRKNFFNSSRKIVHKYLPLSPEDEEKYYGNSQPGFEDL